MPKLLGIIGVLVICAGVDLLWQSRKEIRFWLAAYLSVFRSLLRQPGSDRRPLLVPGVPDKHQGALRVLLGVSFVFLLGPILIAIGITLMFY